MENSTFNLDLSLIRIYIARVGYEYDVKLSEPTRDRLFELIVQCRADAPAPLQLYFYT